MTRLVRAGSRFAVLAGCLILLLPVASAQGEPYRIDWWSADGGGGWSAAADYALGGTAGQADAGLLAGGDYRLAGGYWAAGFLPRPKAPTGLACRSHLETPGWIVDLAWEDNAVDETGYRVERRTSDDPMWIEIADALPPGATAHQDINVAAGKTLTYRVRAHRAGDGAYSDYSDPVSCTTNARPAAPLDLACEADESSGAWIARLAWRDVAVDESDYHVEVSTDDGRNWQERGSPAPKDATGFVDPDLPPDTAYTYQVRAHRHDDDSFSTYSDPARCGTSPRPAAPTSLACRTEMRPRELGGWTGILTWDDNATDETDYLVERKLLGDDLWRVIAALDPGTTAFEHRDALEDEVIRYRVRARRDDPFQVSAYSNVAECIPRLPRKPVIVIPGIGGSVIESCANFAYTAPPLGDLFDYIGCRLSLSATCEIAAAPSLHAYFAAEKVWLGGWGVFHGLIGDDRYFQVLRLEDDGATPRKGVLGESSCLEVPVGRDGILMKTPGSGDDIYDGLATFLWGQGYREGTDLYFFPYDFRRDLTETAARLDALIDLARSRAGADQVDVIAHSMGGLVVRNYVLDPAFGPGKVRQTITLGTPYLGAPKLAGALELGVNFGMKLDLEAGGLFTVKVDNVVELNPAVVRDMIQNWPGGYELVPPKGYFHDPETGHGAPYIRFEGFGPEPTDLDPDASSAYLSDGHNANLVATAEAFHATGVGDLAMATDKYTAHIIAGYKEPSPGRLTILKYCLGAAPPKCGIARFVEETQCGDRTVPLHSALGINSLGLYARDRIHFMPHVDHGALPGNPLVHDYIERLLVGRPTPIQPAPTATPIDGDGRYKPCAFQRPSVWAVFTETPTPAARSGPASRNGPAARSGQGARRQSAAMDRPAQVPPTPTPEPDYPFDLGVRVLLLGDAELHVFDDAGNHSGPTLDPAAPDGPIIPEVLYQRGRHASTVLMTTTGYSLTLRGERPGDIAQLRISAIADGRIERTLFYAPIAITRTTTAGLRLGRGGPRLPPNPPTLFYRYEPNAPLQALGPVAVLDGAAAQDFAAPKTTIQADGARRITLSAQDNPGGAGVDRILYSIAPDGARFERYTGPFTLPPGASITAFAIDLAGNSEQPPAVWLPVAAPSGTPTAPPPRPTATPFVPPTPTEGVGPKEGRVWLPHVSRNALQLHPPDRP